MWNFDCQGEEFILGLAGKKKKALKVFKYGCDTNVIFALDKNYFGCDVKDGVERNGR